MSRGHGSLERKIKKYLTENPNITKMDIIIALAKHNPPTKKERDNIDKSIRLLIKDKTIILSRIGNLWLTNKNYRRYVHPKPKLWRIDPKYIIEQKNKQ